MWSRCRCKRFALYRNGDSWHSSIPPPAFCFQPAGIFEYHPIQKYPTLTQNRPRRTHKIRHDKLSHTHIPTVFSTNRCLLLLRKKNRVNHYFIRKSGWFAAAAMQFVWGNFSSLVSAAGKNRLSTCGGCWKEQGAVLRMALGCTKATRFVQPKETNDCWVCVRGKRGVIFRFLGNKYERSKIVVFFVLHNFGKNDLSDKNFC